MKPYMEEVYISGIHLTSHLMVRSSNVTFNNNKADDGGAINCGPSSFITFSGNS